MLRALKDLETISRTLEPTAAERECLLKSVLQYANTYLDNVAAAPSYDAVGDLGAFAPVGGITEHGISIDAVLKVLAEQVDSVGLNPTSGRFLGYIPGGGLFPSALGDFLADITNRYAGMFFAGPGAVQIENTVLRWLAEIVGYPATASGNLSSGGSIANLIAIVTARESAGIVGDMIPRSVIYLTEHVHHCIHKALRVAGLGPSIQRIIPVDDCYRMRADALEQAILADKQAGLTPWLIVATAGTTNTGSVDPLAAIADIASAHRLWFHIDGAYGGLFILCPEGQAMLGSMDRSDSLVIDPHKTLFLPYGTGAVLVRDRQKQYAAFTAEAAYIQNILDEEGDLSPADLSPELTKHNRALRLWLPLKLFGVCAFRAALSEKIYLARYFHERMLHLQGFEVGPAPDLSVVTYRYLPKRGDADDFNQRLMHAIQEEGKVFISGTRIDGKFILRAAISSFRTHMDEIEIALDVLERQARLLEQ